MDVYLSTTSGIFSVSRPLFVPRGSKESYCHTATLQCPPPRPLPRRAPLRPRAPAHLARSAGRGLSFLCPFFLFRATRHYAQEAALPPLRSAASPSFSDISLVDPTLRGKPHPPTRPRPRHPPAPSRPRTAPVGICLCHARPVPYNKVCVGSPKLSASCCPHSPHCTHTYGPGDGQSTYRRLCHSNGLGWTCVQSLALAPSLICIVHV